MRKKKQFKSSSLTLLNTKIEGMKKFGVYTPYIS